MRILSGRFNNFDPSMLARNVAYLSA
jgi:hypothetical protein